jgi:hypothetical protein
LDGIVGLNDGFGVMELLEKPREDKGDFSNRVTLKNLIRSLFQAVWVGEKDEEGKRELVFDLKSGEGGEYLVGSEIFEGNPHSHSVSNCVGGTKKVRDRVKMGWMTGLEPATTRITI